LLLLAISIIIAITTMDNYFDFVFKTSVLLQATLMSYKQMPYDKKNNAPDCRSKRQYSFNSLRNIKLYNFSSRSSKKAAVHRRNFAA